MTACAGCGWSRDGWGLSDCGGCGRPLYSECGWCKASLPDPPHQFCSARVPGRFCSKQCWMSADAGKKPPAPAAGGGIAHALACTCLECRERRATVLAGHECKKCHERVTAVSSARGYCADCYKAYPDPFAPEPPADAVREVGVEDAAPSVAGIGRWPKNPDRSGMQDPRYFEANMRLRTTEGEETLTPVPVLIERLAAETQRANAAADRVGELTREVDELTCLVGRLQRDIERARRQR